MREGLYRVRFRTAEDEGAGVATLRDGRFLGGDSSMAYVGDYTVDGAYFVADLAIEMHTFLSLIVPVLKQERARIHLTGTVEGDRITLAGEGETPSRPRLDVEMDFLSE